MRYGCLLFSAVILAASVGIARSDDAAKLRLVPFPKEVVLQSGEFSLNGDLVLEAPAASAEFLGQVIGDELRRAGLPLAETRAIAGDAKYVRLSRQPGGSPPELLLRQSATAEDYALEVRPDEIVCCASGDAGVFYGVQTLCQLIRANRRGDALACLSIRDWPTLRWRCFQDDMTRGPSATLDTLKREVDLGALVKMNLFTYYMEHQFAFQKHPVIGPKDGSLTAEELAALVAYAMPRQMDILGSQNSFAHSKGILSHPEFAAARETMDIFSPVKEETYQLLDDLYSEVIPVLPFPWFSIGCDEVELGNGPSKDLIAKIGVGGVYVQHIRRLHDLITKKYGKRVMMWGDIVEKHQDKLDQLPKDIIMLAWDYESRPSLENKVLPFAKSGFDFFVCPGVNDWLRILPDFEAATVNIQNFVRDGVKHGALGMLLTEWKDDGETLRGYNWHGYAWGAECAWNGSTTSRADFNRRIGAVLFAEKGDHFGRAIELLCNLHNMRDLYWNVDFWEPDEGMKTLAPDKSVHPKDAAAIRASAEALLNTVRPAIEHLDACRKEAAVNAALLDDFLYGARRQTLVGQRMLDNLEMLRLYSQAARAADKSEALKLLRQAEPLARRNRDALQALADEFARIWHTESKPYALDITMGRYAKLRQWYDDLAAKLAAVAKQAEAGQPLPPIETLGLPVPTDL